jgi:hypothetical protein
MKKALWIIILLVLLVSCHQKDKDHTTTRMCDQYGCVTCKTYANYDNTKWDTKCSGTGEYAAIYADNENGDPEGTVVEELPIEEDTGGE